MQNEHDPLADKILHRIEDEHVMPTPQWRFSARNGLWWTLWAIVMLLGAGVSAALVYVIANAEWSYRVVTYGSTLKFLLDTLPILWIALLALAVFIGYENIRKTKIGYRYPVVAVILLTLVGTVAGGVLLHAFGVGETIEQTIGTMIPQYHPTLQRNRTYWINPSRGFLAGEIFERRVDAPIVMLRSFDGRVWTLMTTDMSQRGRDILMRFDDVRVVGLPFEASDATGTRTFYPCFAFPWDEHHALFAPSHRPPHGAPMPFDRDLTAESTTSCQRLPTFPSLEGIQQNLH